MTAAGARLRVEGGRVEGGGVGEGGRVGGGVGGGLGKSSGSLSSLPVLLPPGDRDTTGADTFFSVGNTSTTALLAPLPWIRIPP